MSVRFYTLLWLIFLGVVGIFFVTGGLTPVATVVFGLILFGLVFMGMMSVLPGTIMHHPQPKTAAARIAVSPVAEIHDQPARTEDPSSKSIFVDAIAQH